MDSTKIILMHIMSLFIVSRNFAEGLEGSISAFMGVKDHFTVFVQSLLQCNKAFAKQKPRLKLMTWFRSQYLLMMFVKENDHYTSSVKPSPLSIFITLFYASVNQTGPIIKNKQKYQLTEITASDILSN